MIKKFKKKPIIFEAIQFTMEDGVVEKIKEFCGSRSFELHQATEQSEAYGVIQTLEGEYTVTLGSWVIKGVLGEVYSIKEAILKLTYDEVSGTDTSVHLTDSEKRMLDELEGIVLNNVETPSNKIAEIVSTLRRCRDKITALG